MPPSSSSTSKVVPITVAVTDIAEMSKSQLADYYGERDRRVRLFQPTLDEYAAARKRLIALTEDEPPEKGVAVEGCDYAVNFGARKQERTITDPRKAFAALVRALGRDGAIASIAIPLGALDKVTTEEHRKGYVIQEQ